MENLLLDKSKTLLEKIQIVKAKYPYLTASGFDLKKQFSDFESERKELEKYLIEADICLTYLKLVFKLSHIDYHAGNSYGYKHKIEKWTLTEYGRRIYIPNGVFITAALIAGFKISEPTKDSPNVFFNILDKTNIPKMELNIEDMYQHYRDKIVCYFDILGWQEKIKKSENDPYETERIIKIYLRCKNLFEDYFRVNSDDFQINITSDSFFISWDSKIRNNRKILNIIKMMVQSLAYQEFFMRGGICLGKIKHDGAIIIGPAITEAYLLEKKCAIYPRIIFSRQITEDMIKPQNTQSHLNNLRTKNYSKDSDMFIYIDYFSFKKDARIVDLTSNEEDPKLIGQEEYYLKLRKLIKDNLKSDDPKILMKYEWMKDKFNKAIELYVEDYSTKRKLKIK